jgi:hypothetical protein
MKEESPKIIYLNKGDCDEEFDWVYHEGVTWCTDKIDDTDIEYIRKDVYDARIKQLEEVLRNSLRCGWHSMEGSIDCTFDDLTEQEIRQFREDAKNALEKESE